MAFLRTNRRNERGAALIEAALVTPVFFLLIFGIFEMGLLYRDSLTNANASKAGARAASVNGSSLDADYLVLRSVTHGLAPVGLENIDNIVVFKASGPGDTVPESCKTASQTSICNHYSRSDFFKEIRDPGTGTSTGNFGCSSDSAIDRYWCPSQRNTTLGESEYVGVYVQARHNYITGFFGASSTLEDTTIIRLEPTEFG